MPRLALFSTFTRQQAFLLSLHPNFLFRLTMAAIFIVSPSCVSLYLSPTSSDPSNKALNERLDHKSHALCHHIFEFPVTFHMAHSHHSTVMTQYSWLSTSRYGYVHSTAQLPFFICRVQDSSQIHSGQAFLPQFIQARKSPTGMSKD